MPQRNRPSHEDPAEGSRSVIDRELARQGNEKKKTKPDGQASGKSGQAPRSSTGL
jgi:hypothetical protein